MDNLSAVLYAKNDLRLEQREIPVAGKGELLIRVHTTGICGSDVHYFEEDGIGPYVLVGKPFILGHESSGTVEAVGEGVQGFAAGDRVAMEPTVPCSGCVPCKTGAYNLCPGVRNFATPPDYDGTLTRFIIHPASACYKLPSSLSYEEGALLEPLSVGVHACKRAGVTMGQRVLVLGAGPVGILTAMVTLAHGVTSVVITDIHEGRLATAKAAGVQHAVNVKDLSTAESREKVVAALGQEPDVALDCIGIALSMETAILATRPGGVVALVGMGAARCDLPTIDVICKEIDIKPVYRYTNCYPTAIDLAATKKVNLSKLPVAHYSLEQTHEAFERWHKADVVKVFIHSDDTRPAKEVEGCKSS